MYCMWCGSFSTPSRPWIVATFTMLPYVLQPRSTSMVATMSCPGTVSWGRTSLMPSRLIAPPLAKMSASLPVRSPAFILPDHTTMYSWVGPAGGQVSAAGLALVAAAAATPPDAGEAPPARCTALGCVWTV